MSTPALPKAHVSVVLLLDYVCGNTNGTKVRGCHVFSTPAQADAFLRQVLLLDVISGANGADPVPGYERLFTCVGPHMYKYVDEDSVTLQDLEKMSKHYDLWTWQVHDCQVDGSSMIPGPKMTTRQ